MSGPGSYATQPTGEQLYMLTCGRILRALRRQAGRTQAEISMRTEISQSALSRYENGDGSPTLWQWYLLAKAIETIDAPEVIFELSKQVFNRVDEWMRKGAPTYDRAALIEVCVVEVMTKYGEGRRGRQA